MLCKADQEISAFKLLVILVKKSILFKGEKNENKPFKNESYNKSIRL